MLGPRHLNLRLEFCESNKTASNTYPGSPRSPRHQSRSSSFASSPPILDALHRGKCCRKIRYTLHLCYLVIRILQEEDSFSPHQIFLAHCLHCSKSEVGLDCERCSSCIDPVTCQILTPENVTQTRIHRFTSYPVNPYSH